MFLMTVVFLPVNGSVLYSNVNVSSSKFFKGFKIFACLTVFSNLIIHGTSPYSELRFSILKYSARKKRVFFVDIPKTSSKISVVYLGFLSRNVLGLCPFFDDVRCPSQ